MSVKGTKVRPCRNEEIKGKAYRNIPKSKQKTLWANWRTIFVSGDIFLDRRFEFRYNVATAKGPCALFVGGHNPSVLKESRELMYIDGHSRSTTLKESARLWIGMLCVHPVISIGVVTFQSS